MLQNSINKIRMEPFWLSLEEISPLEIISKEEKIGVDRFIFISLVAA